MVLWLLLMADNNVHTQLKELRLLQETFAQKVQDVSKSLVGLKILYIRGRIQNVQADVISFCTDTGKVRVRNVESDREYFVDIAKVKIIDIL